MDRSRKEAMISPTLRLQMPRYSSSDLASEDTNNPNIWFLKMFPESVRLHGPGFLQGTYDDADGLRRFVPLELNEDAWAHALGGDRRLGYRVVYYLPEESWWFFDPLVGAYCLTNEEKLKALLSSFLIRCSQELGSLVDIHPLVTKFRKTGNLERVIERGRALHAADAGFFKGEKGHKRMIDGKIVEPTARPSYELFVEKALTKEPSSAVTVSTAFSHYFNFCKEHHLPPLSRHEFKSLVAEVVREHFAVGLRNDVPGQNGKAQEGWCGLRIRLQDHAALGLS